MSDVKRLRTVTSNALRTLSQALGYLARTETNPAKLRALDRLSMDGMLHLTIELTALLEDARVHQRSVTRSVSMKKAPLPKDRGRALKDASAALTTLSSVVGSLSKTGRHKANILTRDVLIRLGRFGHNLLKATRR